MGTADNPFNIAWWFGRISRILSEYSLGVLMGPADSPFNIAWLFDRISRILAEY